VSELFDISTGHNKALYSQGYKYITYEHQKASELYNLALDPGESSNLAGAKNEKLD
jgi:hypothetical protein